MSRESGGIFVTGDIWAENGEKTGPSFDKNIGWPVQYSQPGGLKVERKLMNYMFNAFSALAYDVNRYGSNLAWSDNITYEIGASVIGSNGIRYKALTINTNKDPTNVPSTDWSPIKVAITGDNNITVSTNDNTNQVNISLNNNLSNYALANLTNVPIGDIYGKFADGNYTYKSLSGNIIKNNMYDIVTDTNITFTSDNNTKKLNFSLIKDLNSLLEKDLSNLVLSNLLNLFEAGTGITITDNNGKIKIDNTADSSVFMLRDTSNITLAGELANFNRLFKIGVAYPFLVDNTPPYQGLSGVIWELISEGNALMTGVGGSTGSIGGTNRLDNGSVDGTAITIAQMAAHGHTVNGYNPLGKANRDAPFDYNSKERNLRDADYFEMDETGGNQPHDHILNVKYIKVKLWKRVS